MKKYMEADIVLSLFIARFLPGLSIREFFLNVFLSYSYSGAARLEIKWLESSPATSVG